MRVHEQLEELQQEMTVCKYQAAFFRTRDRLGEDMQNFGSRKISEKGMLDFQMDVAPLPMRKRYESLDNYQKKVAEAA